MKTRLIPTLTLLAVLIAACAPAAGTEIPTQVGALVIAEPSAAPAITDATTPVPVVDAPTALPVAVATSRGPDLEATDPATVNLASGGLHFVEFFRFT